jgi:hypothetical protein
LSSSGGHPARLMLAGLAVPQAGPAFVGRESPAYELRFTDLGWGWRENVGIAFMRRGGFDPSASLRMVSSSNHKSSPYEFQNA